MPALLRSLANATYARVTVATARTATYSGTAFDSAAYDGTVKFLLDVGAVTGTSPTCDFKITHSDTSGGTYTDVTGATASQITATGIREINVDIGAAKQFLKVTGTIAGTTPSFTISEAIVGQKKYQ